jgi:AraC-like DNA-binding protein
MIAITNNYLPKFQNLVKESKALQPPKQYQNATDLYTKSLESELQSNNHFRNYISTNNSTENKLSSKLLSDAFNYETEAFKKLQASGSFTIVP